MIGTLEEAWNWYNATKATAQILARLGGRYWDVLPWDGALGRDNRLRDLQGGEVEGQSRAVLEDLDDLCVLLMFSSFEPTIRERALKDVAAEVPTVHHPALIQALEDLNETIRHGSFYRVLGAYKRLDPDLTEEVNQVRRYRNWVAHGRTGEQPSSVEPAIAYERLTRFLVESMRADFD